MELRMEPKVITSEVTSTGGTVTWTTPPQCPVCGGYRRAPFAYWSIVPPKLCQCPASIPTVQIIPATITTIKLCKQCGYADPWCKCKKEAAPASSAPAAWQCPGCHRWQAPHTARCDCEEQE